MPTYAYRCQNCGSEFEKVQKFSDKPVTKCLVCGKGPVRRLMQPSAIVFKGSGWYATDHRSSSANTGGNGQSKGEKAEKGEGGEKSEKREKADKSEKSEKSEKAAASDGKSAGDAKPAKKESKATSSDE